MSIISTKLKDGRVFLATIDQGVDGTDIHDAYRPLENEKLYWGQLFDGSMIGQSPWVEYDSVENAVFKGSELEELPGEYRLVKM